MSSTSWVDSSNRVGLSEASQLMRADSAYSLGTAQVVLHLTRKAEKDVKESTVPPLV